MTKVLVIEDDSFLVDAYSTKLRKAGFKTILAPDGEAGLAKAKSEHPDVILLDLLLPKRNGFDVLAYLKGDRDLSHVPVVVLSNLGQERDVEQVRQLGADDYLIKANVSMKEIIAKIEQVVKSPQRRTKIKDVKRVAKKSEFKERTTDRLAKKTAKPSRTKRVAKDSAKHVVKRVAKSAVKQRAVKKKKAVR